MQIDEQLFNGLCSHSSPVGQLLHGFKGASIWAQ